MKNIKIKNVANMILYFLRPKFLSTGILTLLTLFLGFLEMLNVLAIFPVLVAGIQNISASKDVVENSNKFIGGLQYLANMLDLSLLVTSSLLLLLITLFTFVYKIFYTWYEQRLITELLLIHKIRIFNTLINSSFEFISRIHRGKFNQLNSVSIEAVAILLDYVAKFFSQFITLILLLCLIGNGGLGLLALLGAIGCLYFFIVKHVSKKNIQECSSEIHEAKINESNLINEVFTGVQTIRNYGVMSFWLDKFNELSQSLKEKTIKIHIGYVLPGALLQLVMGVGLASFGFYMGSLSPESILQLVPIMGVFIIAISRTNSTLSSLVNSYTTIVGHYPAANNLYHYMHSCNDHQVKDAGIYPVRFSKEIRFANVSFFYKEKKSKVLTNFNMSIFKGEIVALMGRSGSGKSTIINMLMRNFEPSSGQIYIDDINIGDVDVNHYRSNFAVVSQDAFLIHGSVADNIRFGGSFSDLEIKEALKNADALEFVSALSNGVDTVIGEGGVQLSGGQKQRLSLARALLRNPEMLILDEPSSALDKEAEKSIFQSTKKMSNGRTILIITHSTALAKMCDRIIDLSLH